MTTLKDPTGAVLGLISSLNSALTSLEEENHDLTLLPALQAARNGIGRLEAALDPLAVLETTEDEEDFLRRGDELVLDLRRQADGIEETVKWFRTPEGDRPPLW